MPEVLTFPGVEYEAGTSGDIYVGRSEALIAAGIIDAAQVPGAPGMPKSSITFVDGVPQPRGAKPAHDERWMQATMYGRQLRLTKGISEEEQRRRSAARRAEIEESERSRPKTDIGMEAAVKAMKVASALFNVGDRVMCGKHPVIVTGGYKLRRVNNDDGEFLDAESGKRIDYQWGYTCQYRNGEEYFFEPYQLTDDDGCPTHLRLVSGKSTLVTRPLMEFRERERM